MLGVLPIAVACALRMWLPLLIHSIYLVSASSTGRCNTIQPVDSTMVSLENRFT